MERIIISGLSVIVLILILVLVRLLKGKNQNNKEKIILKQKKKLPSFIGNSNKKKVNIVNKITINEEGLNIDIIDMGDGRILIMEDDYFESDILNQEESQIMNSSADFLNDDDDDDFLGEPLSEVEGEIVFGDSQKLAFQEEMDFSPPIQDQQIAQQIMFEDSEVDPMEVFPFEDQDQGAEQQQPDPLDLEIPNAIDVDDDNNEAYEILKNNMNTN